jgi:hypothetical protein
VEYKYSILNGLSSCMMKIWRDIDILCQWYCQPCHLGSGLCSQVCQRPFQHKCISATVTVGR